MIETNSLRGSAFLAAAAVAVSLSLGCDGNHDAPITRGGGPPSVDTMDAGDQDEAAPVLDGEAGSDAGAEAAPDGDGGDAADAADVSVEAAREASSPSDATQVVPPDPAVPLAAASSSCLDCAEASCLAFIQGCGQISGNAAAGPGKGTSRAALCVETLSCVLSTGCATCDDPSSGCTSLARFGDCYCRWDDPNVAIVPDYCFPPGPDYAGPCKSALERSLETTDATALLAGYSDTSKGGSWALQLMQCLVDNACTTCFPPPRGDAGADGPIDGAGTD